MHITKYGTIIAGGVKIGMASQEDIDRSNDSGFINDTSKDSYTRDDVKQELKFLEQNGYFNLPDNHLPNGAPMSAWKKLWNELF